MTDVSVAGVGIIVVCAGDSGDTYSGMITELYTCLSCPNVPHISCQAWITWQVGAKVQTTFVLI